MNDRDNPYAAPTTAPDAISAHQDAGELAGRGTRLAAAIIDGALMLAPFFLIMFLTGSFNASGNQSTAESLIGGLGAMLLYLAINGWLLHTRGQTVGKMLLKIRIVRMDRRATTFMDCFVKRTLPIQLLGLIPIIGGFISLIDALMIFKADRRCLHDLIAGTEVVVAARA
jgi:uncharacterized RDD family membrane protein YckC